ncbi:MAG: hypothetical protein H6765_09085 [Candidatus Peribacteria bacterium]|nr:MAG: hypothetical protein H6765_09085 [Candidatus Peribacteria bacterium]
MSFYLCVQGYYQLFRFILVLLMELHPLVVHFPIALLVLYCLIEMLQILPFAKHWDLLQTKAILLFVGLAGAYAALQTGEIAAEKYKHNPVVELHEEFAETTVNIFLTLAIIYVVYLLYKK